MGSQSRAETSLVGIFTLALAVLVAFPIARLVFLALGNGGENIRRAVATPGIGRTLTYTLVLAAVSVLMAVAFGTVLAWLS